jgi:hypothetical protein
MKTEKGQPKRKIYLKADREVFQEQAVGQQMNLTEQYHDNLYYHAHPLTNKHIGQLNRTSGEKQACENNK